MPTATAVPNVLYTLQGNQWTSPGRQSVAPGAPPVVTGPTLRVNGVRFVGPAVVPPSILGDWSDSNLPWAYTSTDQFTTNWPVGTYIVPLRNDGADYYECMMNTVLAANRRVVVDVSEARDHQLTLFRHVGIPPGQPGYDPTYAFGFWHPNLQGVLGLGPDKTFITMAGNSFTSEQMTWMQTNDAFATAAFAQMQTGVMRFDGANPSSPVLIAGVTFRAADQQLLPTVKPDVPVYVPQPAPHLGVQLFTGAYSELSYTRFQAAGRAMTSQPPFELANLSTGRGFHNIHNVELDGRRSPELDPRRPRRCVTIMGNNEGAHKLTDVWGHHSNVSRYAMNDQNGNTFGTYTAERVKFDHITDQQNTDPNMNNGLSLGGWTNASAFGWESVAGVIDVHDSVIEINNSSVSGAFPAHFQLTYVGSRNPQGGRLHAKGNTYRHTAYPQLDGFCTFRIAVNCFWYTDGVANTLDVRRADNVPLTPFQWSGTWPPSAAQLAAANVKPSTHYIYKGV